MQCANCGKDLQADTAYCPFCGEKQIAAHWTECPKCGGRVEEGMLFCPSCGEKQIVECWTECPECGGRVENGMSFCPSCGTELIVEDLSEGSECGVQMEEQPSLDSSCNSHLTVFEEEEKQPKTPTESLYDISVVSAKRKSKLVQAIRLEKQTDQATAMNMAEHLPFTMWSGLTEKQAKGLLSLLKQYGIKGVSFQRQARHQ